MTKLVCKRNGHLFINLTVESLIYLNEKNSDLILREGINTITHNDFMKHRNDRDMYNETYDRHGCILYHKQGDYCITSNLDSVSHLAFRTHPDFIDYIENTNQTELEIITIPVGNRIIEKSLGKEICPGSDFEDFPLRFVVVISDDDVIIL